MTALWRSRRPTPAPAPSGLTSAAEVSSALLRVREPEDVAQILLDETARIVGVPFAFLVLVSEDGAFARGLLGRSQGRDLEWVRDLVVDLHNEPSGIASAVFDGAPFAVYDVASSSIVSRRLAALAQATSAAFVPIVADGRVIAVLVAGETQQKRAFTNDDLALLAALGAEGALALDRARKEVELEEALERERLIADISLKLRAELRLEDAMRLAVEEAGKALGATRCFLRLGPADAPVAGAEWHLPEVEPLGEATLRLPGPALAARERRTIAIFDTHTDPRLDEEGRELLDSLGTRSVLAAPIQLGDEVLGAIGFHRALPGEWRHGSVALAEGVARELGSGLRAARLIEESLRQAQIQQGFYRIASVLGESLSIEETFEAVAHAAAVALGGTSAALLMPRGDHREVVGAHDLPPKLMEALAGGEPGPALALAADERRIVAAPDLADDDRFDPGWRKAARAAGVASLLAVPVESPRGDRAGLALVLCEERRQFTDDDVELARHLAEAARGALERSQLFEAERTSRALAQQLARTGGLLATELDPDAVLQEVAQQARELLGADACTIALLEGDELVVSAVAADDAEVALGARAPAAAHLAGDVAQSRLPVVVESTEGDRRGVGGDPLLLAGYLAYLGVPLVGPEGALHGVLAVYSQRPRPWQAEEVDALLALAGNTSAALSNAELYQRVALEKERSFAILANIADGIVAVDRDGAVVLWNAAAEQITGVPAVEALGRTPAQLLGRALESEGDAPSGDRLVSISRGDEEVWLSLTEAVMRDPAGATAGRIFAFRDISADRLVEQMKSDFVSTVSHELRTPLTSIYGFSETLLRRDVLFDEEERRVFMGYIASESERLTAIVDALLNVARLDTGDLQVNLAAMDVRPVLDEVVAGAKEESDVNGHHFVLDVPPEPLPVEADREKVRQVLQNLLDNAIKYSPDGGTVTVEARRGSDAVEVRVVDQGIGIPRVEQERIFRKFYRAEAAAQGGAGGTGLGLFIAQGLVTAMGGRIWVESAEGEGSSFGFALPLARE